MGEDLQLYPNAVVGGFRLRQKPRRIGPQGWGNRASPQGQAPPPVPHQPGW